MIQKAPTYFDPGVLSWSIDHTNLRPNATAADITRLCKEAIENEFRAVCIYPYWITLAKKILGTKLVRGNSWINVCTVIGFPDGVRLSDMKRREARAAIDAGADELDMVMNLGAFFDKRYTVVLEEIKDVIRERNNETVKVIIETGLLTPEQIATAAKLVLDSGANYVKTCTGFNGGKATLRDIKIICTAVKEKLPIKASGGIKTYRGAMQLIDSGWGANRLGTSNAIKIMEEARAYHAKKERGGK